MARPNFVTERHFENYTAYPLDGQPGAWGITPHRLTLDTQSDGAPDLRLTLIRALRPTPRTYGVLAIRLRLDYDPADAQAQLAEGGVPPLVQPFLPDGGYLRLSLGEHAWCVPLIWNGLSQTTLRLTLSAEEATLVKAALADATMPVSGLVVLKMTGRAVKMPAIVTFNPADMIAELANQADENGLLTYTALERWSQQDWNQKFFTWQDKSLVAFAPPFNVMGPALLDHLAARYLTLAEPPTNNPEAVLALPSDVVSGEVMLDLEMQSDTWRPAILQWEPLQVVRPHIATFGITRFVLERETPPLPTGAYAIEVTGNLPSALVNVLSVGANLHIPARAPLRPHPINVTATLEPPDDAASVTVRLGPRETLSYEVRPFIVLCSNEGIRSFDGPPRDAGDTNVLLTVDDFAGMVRFAPLTAEPNLLDLATLSGEVRWQYDDKPMNVAVNLTKDAPLATLAVPMAAEEATVHLIATALDGDATLEVPPFALDDGYITLSQFPEYGAHQISIAWTPPADAAPLTLTLQAETDTEPTFIHLRPDRPTATWGYVVLNPFKAGYRYCFEPDGEWSETLSPLTAPQIDVP